MLTIEFVNTGRRDEPVANYDVTVKVNGTLIHRDRIVGHYRADGWRQLVRMLGQVARRKRRAPVLCAGVGDQAVRREGPTAGYACPKCGGTTLPFANGRVRPHRVQGS